MEQAEDISAEITETTHKGTSKRPNAFKASQMAPLTAEAPRNKTEMGGLITTPLWIAWGCWRLG